MLCFEQQTDGTALLCFFNGKICDGILKMHRLQRHRRHEGDAGSRRNRLKQKARHGQAKDDRRMDAVNAKIILCKASAIRRGAR